MATQASRSVFSGFSKLDGAAAIALVVKESMRSRTRDWPYIRDISQLLYDLRAKGFRFKNVGLRPVPGGYYSEGVETFVGQLLSMGYATQRSPIRLEEKGEILCNEILQGEEQDAGDELTRLKSALNDLLSTRDASS